MYGLQTVVLFVSTMHLSSPTLEKLQEKPLFG
jgi:hypothetical protein